MSDAPPLFERATRADAPAPDERALLEELEGEARALDVLDADPEAAAPDVFAWRRSLLVRLDAAGLFEDRRVDAKLQALVDWSLPTLLAYARAALDLHAYYRSAERAREVPDHAVPPNAEPPIVGGPVSVDWFRRGVPTPAPHHPYAWLGYFEHLLRTSVVPDRMASEQIVGVGGHVYRFAWRREDGTHPALVWGAAGA